MSTSLDADGLLEHGRSLIARPYPSLVGLWQRTAVFLARQALELAVRDALASRAPGAEKASARAQFLCLPSYVSTPVAQEAAYLWGVLSRACHQHPYELSPTADELSRWLAGVERVVERLETGPARFATIAQVEGEDAGGEAG